MRVLVTGGTSKIGEAILRKIGIENDLITTISSRKSDFKLAPKDFNSRSLEVVKCDFTNFNLDSDPILSEAEKGFDIIVLNACTKIPDYKMLHEHDAVTFNTFVRQNTDANIRILQKALPSMINNKFGRIVFVSTMAVEMGLSKYSPYIVAKAALEGLMRNIAVDYGKHNIFANSVRPGIVKTERTAVLFENPKYELRAKRIIPAGEIGTPEQVADVVALLVAKNSYVNGQVINVSGGLPLVSTLAKI